MALVGKSGYGRYFREREPGFMQHSLGTFQTPAQKVAVGRHSYRLVEGAREMMRGQPCHGSQNIEAYFLVQMRFHILADALRNYRRQSAAAARGRLFNRQMVECADARAAMHERFGPATRSARFAQRRRKQYAPPRPAAGAREPGGNVPIAGLAENRTVMVEDCRQMTPLRHAPIAKTKSAPRNPIGAHDPLVLIHGQQQRGFVRRRQGRHGPGVPEVLAKQAFFDGSRRNDHGIQNQRQRPVVFLPVHSGDVQNRH
jgi:hypothetical protein